MRTKTLLTMTTKRNGRRLSWIWAGLFLVCICSGGACDSDDDGAFSAATTPTANDSATGLDDEQFEAVRGSVETNLNGSNQLVVAELLGVDGMFARVHIIREHQAGFGSPVVEQEREVELQLSQGRWSVVTVLNEGGWRLTEPELAKQIDALSVTLDESGGLTVRAPANGYPLDNYYLDIEFTLELPNGQIQGHRMFTEPPCQVVVNVPEPGEEVSAETCRFGQVAAVVDEGARIKRARLWLRETVPDASGFVGEWIEFG
jgi:hypothetical protein